VIGTGICNQTAPTGLNDLMGINFYNQVAPAGLGFVTGMDFNRKAGPKEPTESMGYSNNRP